jgi:hypothetical protein
MGPLESSPDVSAGTGEGAAAAPPGDALAREVFGVLGDRMVARATDIERFTETGCPFDEWCIWESLSALRAHGTDGGSGVPGMGWKVQPRPPYAAVGVTGSRETADLLVNDPAHAARVLIELSIIHDWSRNEWIGRIDGDTERLTRRLVPGIARLQIILAASLESPIEVNPIWQQWLGMSKVWNRPTDLKRVMPLGVVGQLRLHGWVLS